MEEFQKQWMRLLKKRRMIGLHNHDKGMHLSQNGTSWVLSEIDQYRAGSTLLCVDSSLMKCLSTYEEKLDDILMSEADNLMRRAQEIQSELSKK